MSNSTTSIMVMVIVLVSAVVIFNGFSTVDSANLAAFTQKVDNVNSAVINLYANLFQDYAVKGIYTSREKVYYEVATGIALEDSKAGTDIMNGADVTSKTSGNKNFQRINPKTFTELTLPDINGTNETWYITKDGTVFNASGFVFEDRTYFSASCYCKGKVPSSTSQYNEDIAEKIAEAILNDENIVEF